MWDVHRYNIEKKNCRGHIQDVHKVSLQFQKFITKEIDEISSSDLVSVLSGYQGFYHIVFQVDE